MVFGFDNGGQTCNVFWSYIPLLNKAIEENSSYIIPIHERSINDYPKLLQCKWLKFPFHNKLFLKLFGEKKTRSLAIHCFNNPLLRYEKLCKRHPKHFVNGYDLRETEIPMSTKTIIRDLFVPEHSISNRVEKSFEEIRQQNIIIFGVHIRRGDYKSWKEGKYFFNFDTYSLICKQIISDFKDKNIMFCLVSNESIPDSTFKDIPYFQTPDRTPTQDLYALSLCDYVIGPPSSFSRFAAFRGDVPIAFISKSEDRHFNFRKLDNLAKYETGEIVEEDF